MIHYKKCPICQIVYKPKRNSQRTCSSICGHIIQGVKCKGSNNTKYNKHLKYRHCMYCNKWFRPKSITDVGKYCSKECKNFHHSEKARVKLSCEECGVSFYGVKNRVEKYAFRYCSRGCYLKNCNKRSYKVEYIISVLKSNNINNIQEEVTFSWLKSPKGYSMFLDLFLPDSRIAIEYDGEHHYKKLYNEDLCYIQIRDQYKDFLCKLAGLSIIRFSYKEDLSDSYILHKLNFVV